ncbi:MAG: ATP-grasp domain-containing protein [Erysipelotrichaceae bacterium]|nr:ATP-grasp domain-containing protein [Erysipelotrichaceae bacterium]
MNFIMISPNYPENYWMFCRGLKKYGATVLAIIDTAYDNLLPELKENIDECYVVSNFNNYDEMLRAVGYFTFKYGKIDWIESNNEAWLDLDARLRDDFNVKTGFSYKTIQEYQSKAAMKKYYEKANIPTARYYLVDSKENALQFAKKIGYPLVLKPDHGVGATFTYTIKSDEDLIKYLDLTKEHQMILEEYIEGDVFTLDGVCDQEGTIRYLNSLEYVGNCMDSVQYQQSIGAYTAFTISDEYRSIAQRTIHAFALKNRFFHCEFFRLTKDKEGLGKKGTVIGLEVNFRPPGGFAPDLMNYAGSLDVYDIWAQVLLTQQGDYMHIARESAGFAGRRNSIAYKYRVEEIEKMYKDQWIATNYLPEAYAATMGDVTLACRFHTTEERDAFFAIAFQESTRKDRNK